MLFKYKFDFKEIYLKPGGYDLFLGIFFFLIGSILAVVFFVKSGSTLFYQAFTPESVFWACGQGFFYPKVEIKPLGDFLWGAVREFDCKSLGTPELHESAGFFYKVQPYITWIAAILWRAFGVNYTSLIPLVFVLYGLYASGIYALSRSFLRVGLAFVATLFLAFSPLALGMVVSLRDFSKAPFFIWALFFLVVAIRAKNLSRQVLAASITAVVIGIGYGFRADLIVMVPFAAIVLIFSSEHVNIQQPGFNRLGALIPPTAFIIAFLISAAPILTQTTRSGTSGTYVMQGATEPFRISAGLDSAGYSLGWAYSDELTLSGVAASRRLKTLDWDSTELAKIPGLEISNAMSQSTAYLGSWANLFAADFIAQALNSAAFMIGFPLFLERYSQEAPLLRSGILPEYSPVQVPLLVYSFAGISEAIYVGIVGALALLYRCYVRSKREAFCIFVLLGLLVTYPGLQFSPRHTFHLEFIWVVCVLSILSVIIECREWRKLPGFLGYVVAFGGLTGVIYLGALQYQKHVLADEVKNLLTLPRQPLSSNDRLLDSGDRFYPVEVPDSYQLLVAGRPDSMTPKIAIIGAQWDVRAAADRLLVHVGGDTCNVKGFRAVAKYKHSKDVWQPLDVELTILRAPASGKATLLFSAFYRPTQYFDGLLVQKEFANCNISIERVVGESSLPFVFTANIDGERILGRSYKKILPPSLDKTNATVSKKAESKS